MSAEEAVLRAQIHAVNELVRGCRSSIVVCNMLPINLPVWCKSMRSCPELNVLRIILDVALEVHRMAHVGVDEGNCSEDEALDSPMPSAAVMEVSLDTSYFGYRHPYVVGRVLTGLGEKEQERCVQPNTRTSRGRVRSLCSLSAPCDGWAVCATSRKMSRQADSASNARACYTRSLSDDALHGKENAPLSLVS
eukprot:8818408-Pyramimonas_sp.AAC.1